MEPQAGLVRDAAGDLYGTTYSGGAYGWGTVFKLDLGGNETVVHAFAGTPDGAQPMAGLMIDKHGNLYGTTYNGGTAGGGTVFKVDASGRESIIHSFIGFADGAYPSGGLLMDDDGVIYGTTQEGGASDSCWGGCGTIFELDKTGNSTVMLSFEPPAANPRAALLLGTNGTLYGTTAGDGECCLGTVFRLSKDTVPTTLHTFAGGTDGANAVTSSGARREGQPLRDNRSGRRPQLRFLPTGLRGGVRAYPRRQGDRAAQIHRATRWGWTRRGLAPRQLLASIRNYTPGRDIEFRDGLYARQAS